MENEIIKRLIYLLTSILLMGCSKNETRYHDDAEDPGLAIFSNTGNNILSCFIDGNAWRTVSRTTSGYSQGTSYEVSIEKKSTNGINDTLIITWLGYFEGSENNEGYLGLHIAVPSNFNYRNLSGLQGQRLNIDSTNGFFATNIRGLNSGNSKGSGSFYFHTARFDSVGRSSYSGVMSGLFDANFNSFKITKGRFDHTVSGAQIHF
ncbi:MAG: hypothetical protein ABIN89_27370 [Chitinophagaceae bacterium]